MDTLQSRTRRPSNAAEEELADLDPWFHNIHLPDGLQTAPHHPLGDFPNYKWKEISPHIPEDLSGWRVLDIGCNAGFYSFALARRGARVDAVDVDPHYLKQADWVRRKLGLEDQVSLRQGQVYDLARETSEYDLVWFMGVFYHLRYPMLALDILARKTQQLFVFQSLGIGGSPDFVPPENLAYPDRAAMQDTEWPRMAFVEKSFAGDPTNWWVPSASAACGMLRAAGLQPFAQPDPETWVCRRSGASATDTGSEYQSVFQN